MVIPFNKLAVILAFSRAAKGYPPAMAMTASAALQGKGGGASLGAG